MANKMYEMIIDSGYEVVKVMRCAKSINELKSLYGGNGEFVRVREVTEGYPISEHKVSDALRAAGFGDAERETVLTCLRAGYANVID